MTLAVINKITIDKSNGFIGVLFWPEPGQNMLKTRRYDDPGECFNALRGYMAALKLDAIIQTRGFNFDDKDLRSQSCPEC